MDENLINNEIIRISYIISHERDKGVLKVEEYIVRSHIREYVKNNKLPMMKSCKMLICLIYFRDFLRIQKL